MIAREIRKRSARVQVLQNTLDRMRNLIEARAIEYADHLGASTGVRDRIPGGAHGIGGPTYGSAGVGKGDAGSLRRVRHRSHALHRLDEADGRSAFGQSFDEIRE